MRARAFFPAAVLALSAALAASGGCGGDHVPSPPDTTTSTGTTTTTTSSTTTTTGSTTTSGTTGSTTTSGSGGTGGGTVTAPHDWKECQGSDQAWVRRTILAVAGRRALGQAEVNAYEDAVVAIRAADPNPPPAGALDSGRRAVARALMREDAFRERWSDFLLEALHVNRIETKSQEACYGPPNPSAIDDGALAAYVRDNDSSFTTPPLNDFTMGQLLSSALELDDLSVVYRGNLFAMLNLPITGANVGPDAMERIRRQNFGAVFSSAYIHRDIVCLNCHNSEYAVTYDADPTKNRHWAIPGLFEQALYGASNGLHPPAETATKGPDDLRAFSVFRVTGVAGGSQRPWNWAQECGQFDVPSSDDPLGIDAYFGTVRSTAADPQKGLRASVWDLERALRRGVDQLAAHGLTRGPMNELPDADEAFAYLVAMNVVEKVWDEVMGHGLTIANYFPRTQIARDTLMALTDHFVATRFSLKALLLDILQNPAFNLQAPDEGCGDAAYELPNLFDPWTTADADPQKRPNSPGDSVFAISSRPLIRSLHRAMGWPYLPEYPGDETFQVTIGFFIKDADPGFRGLDFQGRLSFENVYGRCADLSAGGDFVKQIVQKAEASPGATLEQAVIAVKDRLVGEPSIDPAERQALEAITAGLLTSTDLTNLEFKLRSVCGMLVSTPQMMLGGIVPKDTRDVPALTPPGAAYDDACNALAQQIGGIEPFAITCNGGTLSAVAK